MTYDNTTENLRSMAVLAVLLLMIAAPAPVTADCMGCSASVSPICGQDGLTYMNECLAMCQGVTVAAVSSCTEAAQHETAATTAGVVHIPASECLDCSHVRSSNNSSSGVKEIHSLPAASI